MIGKKINQLATELAPVSTDLTIIGDPVSGVSKKITLAQLGAIFSGAVSFYNDFASFPATGDINVIYCAKDTKKLYLWSGSAYVEVFPSQALLDTYQLRSEKGNANGYASLDSSGKVPISQLPSSIMEYKGTWNAATNTPTLANGTGDTGDVYLCNAAGTVNFGAGPLTFAVGDYVVYSGTIWQRSSGAVGTVTSVAASITGDSITISGSPISTSGTLAFAFGGNSTQYINGAGNLITFPSIISQAANLVTEVYNKTGATLTKGTIVYINGGQGNLPTITKAIATGDSTSAQTFGIVQADITNNNNGYVVIAGRLSDLDTQAYTEGTQLYLSSTTAGTWTSTKQYAPAHLVYVGIVVRAHPTQGVVEVKIQNGYELDELHNVAAQTPSNNDGLFYESSTDLWKNKSIATILGYTPQAQLNGTGFVKASGTTITYDNSTYLTTSAAATTYLPMVLSSTAKDIDLNGQTFDVSSKTSPFTSGRLIIDPTYSAIGYQNAGVFDGFKILTNGNAEFSNSGVTRFFNQVRFDSTLTNGTYTYTLPAATGTLALTSDLTGGTVTSVGLSSATSGVTIGSSPITTSGTITLAIATASGSQQGLLSSTDWTTFNNKQSALTNPVTGTGTTNYLPKFTGASTIGDSSIIDNGTNVGIGTATPSARLHVLANNTLNEGVAASIIRQGGQNGNNGLLVDVTNTVGQYVADFRIGNSSVMRLDASANLGLGVTPSAWDSGQKVYQSGLGSFYGLADGGATILVNNGYYNGGWKYSSNGSAGNYQIVQNSHQWLTAPSGTAGNAISFTQAMTLNASGNLSIGNTNDSFKLDVSGTGMFRGKFNVSTNISDYTATFVNSNSSSYGLYIQAGGTYNAIDVYNYTGGTQLFSLTGTGAATFSSSVTATQFDVSSGNGMYNAGTNAVGFQTSGLARVYISSGGNVGIGTTSPGATYSELLQVSKADTGRINITHTNTTSLRQSDIIFTEGTTLQLQVGSILGSGTFNDQNWIRGVANIPLVFYTNDTERMRITSAGELCVGTTSAYGAGFLLNVQGNMYASAAIVAGSSITSISNTNGQIAISPSTNTNAAAFVASNAGGGCYFGKNNSTGGAFTGTAYATVVYSGGDVPMSFYTNDTERMRITSAGNVGINKTNPGSKLAIVGLPTSSSGLTSGDIWNDGGTLKIV